MCGVIAERKHSRKVSFLKGEWEEGKKLGQCQVFLLFCLLTSWMETSGYGVNDGINIEGERTVAFLRLSDLATNWIELLSHIVERRRCSRRKLG